MKYEGWEWEAHDYRFIAELHECKELIDHINNGETMPDMTIEYRWQCVTCEKWSRDIGDYTVTYDEHSHKNKGSYKYDYSCTCKAYEFGKGKSCKHIVAAKPWHCKGGEIEFIVPTALPSGEMACPRCLSPVVSRGHAV